ncbi:MAG TPA: response regulator [Geminicoccaceae bacterium]
MSRVAEVVVVDDEPDLRLLLEDYLGLQGFGVRTAADGRELDRLLAERPADLLVLDRNMPGEDGLAVARRLRAAGARVGILMFTAAGEVEDRVGGLGAGADDYLPKPFELRELLARVRAVLRRLEAEPRAPPPGPRRHRFGRCTLDLEGRRLLDEAGAEVPLTAMEYDLLAVLARHPRQVLSRERLSELAHGRPPVPGDRSVDVRVTRLRQKIERDPTSPRAIRTVRGEGYAYEPGEEDGG